MGLGLALGSFALQIDSPACPPRGHQRRARICLGNRPRRATGSIVIVDGSLAGPQRVACDSQLDIKNLDILSTFHP